MKVIFLDVDGVLTHNDYQNSYLADLNPEKINLLKQIITKTEAKIVLTSSWKSKCIIEGKEHRYKEYYILKELLKEFEIEIHSETEEEKLKLTVSNDTLTKLPKEMIKQVKINKCTTRTAEIYKWLKNHPEVETFIIIDDEDFEYNDFGYSDNFIKTDYYRGGLLQKHVEQAIDILNNTKARTR